MTIFGKIPQQRLLSYSARQINPQFMSGSQQVDDAGSVLEDFYARNDAYVGHVRPQMIGVRDLLPIEYPEPDVTAFAAYHDTFLFTEVVCQMAQFAPVSGLDVIYDLGAGSSIPTIAAFLRTQNFAKRVVAVEKSKEAIDVSRRNVARYRIADKYTFEHVDMLEAVKSMNIGENSALSANPPYLPVPSDSDGGRFGAVDGGEDGTRYLKAVLECEMPTGTLVALEWCSLSNPITVVDLIDRHYDVLYVQAIDISYGLYTEDPAMKTHIISQHAKNMAALAFNADGTIGWTFVGTVLRKK